MSLTIWLTGLSGAGKTTLAVALCNKLDELGQAARHLDGDELRMGLCADLGFSREDRSENIRRTAHVCRLLNTSGVVAVAALISPFEQDRAMARAIIGDASFREVWLSTTLEVCEQRDPKGLYKRARRGEIASFTGVSDVYERPQAPHLILDTNTMTFEACLRLLQATCELNKGHP